MCCIVLGLWAIPPLPFPPPTHPPSPFPPPLPPPSQELEQRVRELEHAHSVTVRTLWLGRCHGSIIATTIATNIAMNIATNIASNVATS